MECRYPPMLLKTLLLLIVRLAAGYTRKEKVANLEINVAPDSFVFKTIRSADKQYWIFIGALSAFYFVLSMISLIHWFITGN